LEGEIRKIKDDAGVGNIDEQRQILQARIGAMQSDIATARALAITTAAEVKKLEERLQSVPERIISSETLEQSMSWRDEQKKEIAKIELDLADLKARYADNSPQVQIAEQRLAAARGTLAAGQGGNERVESINPVWQTMLQRLEDARTNATVALAKESALQSEVDKAQVTLKSINDVELKIKQLLRSANLREDQLRQISMAADRESLLAAFQGEKLNNVSIVQPATLPLRPIAPNRLMLLMIGMFVAGSGAVGLGIASETLSRTTKRPEDIDRLTALPSVSIPIIDAHGFIGNGYMKGRAPGLRVARLLTDNGESQTAVVTRANGTSGGSLARTASLGTTDIRPVRRWSPQLLQSAHGIIDGLLFDSIHNAKHQTAFVTGLISCRPGQGASTLSAYVASAVADRLEASIPLHPDDRVLLIDADLNEPALHRLLSIDDSPGLGDWLAIHSVDGSPITDFTHVTSHARLSVMPSGRSSTPMRLLDRSDLLITEATRHFRHIVMDLPPVSSTPTALRLAAKCNAVLLVVECGNLHQEVVRKSVRALQAAGANVAGVVLNKRRFPIPDWLYQRAS
jgi:Mrp family chromosome partitioning ATPase/LPS O-antigen subunit length determinant protein (WzzB/FepE family)